MKATLIDIYPESKVLECPECGGNMILRKSPKYPHPFYGCTRFPYCTSSHGAHPNGAPLGIPGNAETKEWRIKAHAAMDPLWGRGDTTTDKQRKNYRRKVAYNWLAFQLGIKNVREECHIAMFGVEQCKDVIAVCEGVSWSEMEQWYKARQAQLAPRNTPRKGKMPRYY